MKSIYYDYKLERQILIVLFGSKKIFRKIINQKLILPEYFYLDHHKEIVSKIIECFDRFSEFEITKNVLYNLIREDYAGDDNVIKLYRRAIRIIYKCESEPQNLQFRLVRLKDLYTRRKTYVVIEGVVNKMNDEEFVDVENEIKKLNDFYTKEGSADDGAVEGEVIQELKKNIKDYKKRAKGEDVISVPIGIKWLQKHLGGSYKGEMYIILAFAKIGKSMMLLEIGYQAAKRGNIVVHFTIEMNKIRCTNRFYSRLTKIDSEKFKNNTLTKGDFTRLKKSVKKFKVNDGKYHIVSYPKGCKPAQIESKLYKLKERYGRVDLVTVDYLNDLTPNEKTKKGKKDWDVLGDISWELISIARSFNNGEGIPLWTANQATRDAEGKSMLTAKHFAFSSVPAQHADAVVYIAQTEDDMSENIRRLGFVMARDGADVVGQELLYGETRFCLINSASRRRRMLND